MRTKKELKELFTSFKGLGTLKKIAESRVCPECDKCPFNERRAKTLCYNIVDIYNVSDDETEKTMRMLIDIFTEEKINRNLALIDDRLKYNSIVVYNGKSYKIKGVLKKKFIGKDECPILLNGFGDVYDASYKDCIVKESDMKKEYTLWADITYIKIKGDEQNDSKE